MRKKRYGRTGQRNECMVVFFAIKVRETRRDKKDAGQTLFNIFH
jgi:hypothetical protein